MDIDTVIADAENAIWAYEKIRDELDPILAYSWRSDNKRDDLLDKNEKKLITLAGTIETVCKTLKDNLRLKKDSFQNKMNDLWAKIHYLEDKVKKVGEEIQKYYKKRIDVLKERIKAINESEKNGIESINLRLTQFEKDRASIESYLSEIRSKIK